MEKIQFRPSFLVLLLRLISIAVVGTCISLAVSYFLKDTSALDIPENSPVAGMISEHKGSLVTAVIGFFVLSFMVQAVKFFFIRYELDDRYLSCSSGVLWKQKRSIPLEKVTNIDVRQGPIERVLGIGKIWIFTPSTGSDTPEEELIGIKAPHEMKKSIVERSELASGSSSVQTNVSQGGAVNESVAPLLKEIAQSLKNIEKHLAASKKVEAPVIVKDQVSAEDLTEG